jgi:hypothetical protein
MTAGAAYVQAAVPADAHAAHAHHGDLANHGDQSAGAQPTSERELPCPHCPLGAASVDGSPTSHSLCFAGGDAAEQTTVSHMPLLAKYVPTIAMFEPWRIPASRPPPTRSEAADLAGRVAVELNIRHCVFLI